MIVMLSILIISVLILFGTSYVVPDDIYDKYFTMFFILDAAAYIMLIIAGAYLIGPWILDRGYYG